jgi:calnexin
MRLWLLLVSLAGCADPESAAFPVPLKPPCGYFHFQSFGDEEWKKTWTVTSLANFTGKWELRTTAPPQSYPGEKMIFMTNEKAHYGLSTQFPDPLDPAGKTFIVQFEVRYEEHIECGGSYIKLFHRDNFVPEQMSNESRYIIMFGPDRCGATNKVHFIFRHKNPKNGVYEEKALIEPPSPKRDNINHLYTLIVRANNSFQILIDAEAVKNGSLLVDFAPAVNPPKEVDDPSDIKPADWVDDEKIDDPEAKKPDDWDESQPEYIKDPEKLQPPAGWLLDEPKNVADPDAQRPEGWDEVIHGDWEPPMISNPKCEDAVGCGPYDAPLVKNPLFKGKWSAPKIANPAYKGPWKARQIPNPNYFEDPNPANFEPIIGAGFEEWMVGKNVAISNFFIGNDEAAVAIWNEVHFVPKHAKQAEEKKKLEPKSSKKGGGFGAKLAHFGGVVKDGWLRLCEEYRWQTVAITLLLVLVPLCIGIVCRLSPSAKQESRADGPKTEKTEEEDGKSHEDARPNPEGEGTSQEDARPNVGEDAGARAEVVPDGPPPAEGGPEEAHRRAPG